MRKRQLERGEFVYDRSMRRVWGIFKNALIVLSAIVCVGVLVLWGRSYSGSDLALWTRAWHDSDGARQKWVQLVSKRGRIYIDVGQSKAIKRGSQLGDDLFREVQRLQGRGEFRLMRDKPQPWDYGGPPQPGAWRPVRWAEWGYSNPELGVATGGSGLIVHDWLVAVVFLVAPAIWVLIWWRKRRRLRTGRCRNRGYDLRASPERCPECGREPASGTS